MGLTAFNRYRNRQQTTTQQAETAEIKHLGGGWYEVAGQNYQGREAAEQAAKEANNG